MNTHWVQIPSDVTLPTIFTRPCIEFSTLIVKENLYFACLVATFLGTQPQNRSKIDSGSWTAVNF